MEEKNKIVDTLGVAVTGIVGFAIMLVVFSIGVWVGQERADYSFVWAQNYHRNFGGPDQGMFGNFPTQDFTNGHGVFGQVIKIDGNNLVIEGKDNMEKTIIVPDKITIVNSVSVIKLSDIKINDTIVIIGSPDSQGQVTAKFIRILPSIMPSLMHVHRIYFIEHID